MTPKFKAFIIAPKELYSYIDDNLSEIIDENKVIPLLPYNFKYHNHIDEIIFDMSEKHLIKSHDYVMTLPSSELLNYEEIEIKRNMEAYKRGYQEWLEDKLVHSKKQIEEADLCLIFDNKNIPLNNVTKKEIKSEINFALNKNKPIGTININHNDKKMSLHTDKMTA